jgi:hypothetical protein
MVRRWLQVSVILFSVTACISLPFFPSSPPDTIEPEMTGAPIPATAPSSQATLQPSPGMSPAAPTPPANPLLGEEPESLDYAAQSLALQDGYAMSLLQLRRAAHYSIDLEVLFEPNSEQAILNGRQKVIYTNQEEESLDELVFMLWPNNDQYRGEMSVLDLMVNGERVEYELEKDGLAIRVALHPHLAPATAAMIDMTFQVVVLGQTAAGIPYRFGISDGVLIAPTFYPLIPRRGVQGWDTNAAPPAGDTTNSDVAFYQLKIQTPADLKLAVSGQQIDTMVNASNVRTTSIVSGPVRDVAIAVGPFEEITEEIDGITLRAWFLPDHQRDAERMLRTATQQIQILNARIGPYPYRELDLVDAPGAFAGIEYPALVFLGTLGSGSVVGVTAHEVGHQWFYGVVGNDQLQEPWLDEAAANYTEILLLEETRGPGRASAELSQYRGILRDHPHPEIPLGMPVDQYSSGNDYGLFVYLKGSLFFDQLRAQLGDVVFFDFMRMYYINNLFGYSHSEDFQETAEMVCDCDLEDLFRLWIYEGGPVPGL